MGLALANPRPNRRGRAHQHPGDRLRGHRRPRRGPEPRQPHLFAGHPAQFQLHLQQCGQHRRKRDPEPLPGGQSDQTHPHPLHQRRGSGLRRLRELFPLLFLGNPRLCSAACGPRRRDHHPPGIIGACPDHPKGFFGRHRAEEPNPKASDHLLQGKGVLYAGETPGKRGKSAEFGQDGLGPAQARVFRAGYELPQARAEQNEAQNFKRQTSERRNVSLADAVVPGRDQFGGGS